MAKDIERITLKAGANIHQGVKKFAATMSLERIAGSFDLDLSNTWTVGGKLVTRPVHPLQPCVLAIGGETVITGHVDDAAPGYRKGEKGVKIKGRDLTARLVDCSLEKREFNGQTLLSIAQALCSDFGIPVRLHNWDGGKPLPRYSVDPGETYAKAIEDACRQMGVMMWTDGLGTLLIGRPGGGAYVGTLELGKNIIEAEATDSVADRFSTYTVLTNKTGDSTWAEAGQPAKGMATDSEITLFRPKVEVAETQAEGAASIDERANIRMQVARARGKKTIATVQGWYAPSGALWRPGQSLDIKDRELGRHGRLVVADLSLSAGTGEPTIAKLLLLPESAFKVAAEGISAKGGAW
ncbi:MAG: hypothetical protein K2X44_10175 [Magnetospirillum sp.]|nr:hypothetical protein [Magnetospirillum sp.]